jgi:hypothetical protein
VAEVLQPEGAMAAMLTSPRMAPITVDRSMGIAAAITATVIMDPFTGTRALDFHLASAHRITILRIPMLRRLRLLHRADTTIREAIFTPGLVPRLLVAT